MLDCRAALIFSGGVPENPFVHIAAVKQMDKKVGQSLFTLNSPIEFSCLPKYHITAEISTGILLLASSAENVKAASRGIDRMNRYGKICGCWLPPERSGF